MSTINKKPYIESVLANMTNEELEALLDLMNGEDQTPTYITLVNRTDEHVLSEDDKGITYVNLNVSDIRAQQTYEGYLIYNDHDCVLIYFTGIKNQKIGCIVIDPAKLTWSLVNEPMDIVGLRSEVKDYLSGSEGGGVDPTDVVNIVNDGIAERDVATNLVIEASIAELSPAQIEALQVGDIVKDNNSYCSYIVFRKDTELWLSNVSDNIVTVYRYRDNGSYMQGYYNLQIGEWLYYPTCTITDTQGNEVKVACRFWGSDNSDFYTALNEQLQQVAGMFSVEIPEVADTTSANTAFATLVPYLNAAGFAAYGSLLSALIWGYRTQNPYLMFGSIKANQNNPTDLYGDGDGSFTFYYGGQWFGFTDLQLAIDLGNGTSTLASIIFED